MLIYAFICVLIIYVADSLFITYADEVMSSPRCVCVMCEPFCEHSTSKTYVHKQSIITRLIIKNAMYFSYPLTHIRLYKILTESWEELMVGKHVLKTDIQDSLTGKTNTVFYLPSSSLFTCYISSFFVQHASVVFVLLVHLFSCFFSASLSSL